MVIRHHRTYTLITGRQTLRGLSTSKFVKSFAIQIGGLKKSWQWNIKSHGNCFHCSKGGIAPSFSNVRYEGSRDSCTFRKFSLRNLALIEDPKNISKKNVVVDEMAGHYK